MIQTGVLSTGWPNRALIKRLFLRVTCDIRANHYENHAILHCQPHQAVLISEEILISQKLSHIPAVHSDQSFQQCSLK